MNDSISRKQAVEAMSALVDGCDRDDPYRENPHIDAIIDTLENLPSAQPERKRGDWISLDDFRGKYNEFGYKCSECGEQNDYQDNYCPSCGADMRGEQDDSDFRKKH